LERAIVKVSAADAAKKGLLPASIEVDATELCAIVYPFLRENTYLQLSGPPGGPLGLMFDAYSGVADTTEALERLAATRFAKNTFVAGTSETIELAGEPRRAFTCATGTSLAHSVHLLVLIPEKKASERGVLVDFHTGCGAEIPTPGGVMDFERYGDALRSVRVGFE